jgi:uncharacterized protein YndB with AHSA1/START domain
MENETMRQEFTAVAAVDIRAPASRVWEALTQPALIKEYMFGTTVMSEWKPGAPITWAGEWKGQPYEDRGVILKIKPPRLLQYSHFSPLSGQADKPENYHTVTIELSPKGEDTHVSLLQDKNPSPEARDHSQENWAAMLAAMKKLLEA